MAVNKFLEFNELEENQLTQVEYEEDVQRIAGLTTGIARKELFNKVLRQTSVMSAAVGEFIKENGIEASDESVETLKTAFVDAVKLIARVDALSNVDNTSDADKPISNAAAAAMGDLADLDTTEKGSLVGAINEVDTDVGTNTANIGDLAYTENNYITDYEPLTESVDKLDMAVKDNADLISTNVGDLETLTTTDKSSLVNATNEVKNLVDSNKTQIIEKTSYGVYTGLVVAQQTVADMTVKCSAGTIYMANGDRFAIDAVASISATAADATNPRIDIVYVSSVGAVSYLAGTAAASPAAPTVPAGGQKLAEISVAAGATSIVTANIADKRKNLWTEAWNKPTLLNSWVNVDVNIYDEIAYAKDALNYVEGKGLAKSGTVGYATPIYVLPAGCRPSKEVYFPAASNNVYGTIVIKPNGNVYCASGSNTWFSVRFRFRAEA